jgi:hypothetical protein
MCFTTLTGLIDKGPWRVAEKLPKLQPPITHSSIKHVETKADYQRGACCRCQ